MSYIIHDIIHDIMMYKLDFHALQQPILPRHSALMQPTTIMNLTDQWNFDKERDFADQGHLTDMGMEPNGGKRRYARAYVEAQQSPNYILLHIIVNIIYNIINMI
jgi:hypothetical protein